MHKRYVISGLLVVLFPILWFGAASDWIRGTGEAAWIAKVGTSPIYLDDYVDAYGEYITSTGLPDTPQRRGDFLERLVSMRLLALEAEDAGMGEAPAFGAAWNRVHQKLLIEGYVKTNILAPIKVTEAELQDMFVRVNTRLSASHLYAGTLEEAQALKVRLDDGASFEDLAREVFASEALRESGGRVGEFGFDEMDRAFEDAAYQMEPGQISEPVRTAQGYSIIRLDNRFTNPILTETEFARRLDGLERYVLVRKHDAAREKLRSDILDDLAPEFDGPVLEALLKELNGTSGLADEQALRLTDVIVRFEGGEMDAQGFMQASLATSEEQRTAVTDVASLQSFIRGLLIRDVLLERAEESGIAKSEAYGTAARRERWGLLYEAAWNDMLRQIEVPEDSIQSHMDRFPDEFSIPEQVNVREILLSSASEAARVLRETNMSNFEERARQHSIREGAEQHGGNLGFVTREQLGVLAVPVFDAPTGSIIGPLAVGGRFAILQVLEKSASRKATLDEARFRVENQLRTAWVRIEVRERVASLRQKTNVEKRVDLLATLDLIDQETPSVSPMNP